MGKSRLRYMFRGSQHWRRQEDKGGIWRKQGGAARVRRRKRGARRAPLSQMRRHDEAESITEAVSSAEKKGGGGGRIRHRTDKETQTVSDVGEEAEGREEVCRRRGRGGRVPSQTRRRTRPRPTADEETEVASTIDA